MPVMVTLVSRMSILTAVEVCFDAPLGVCSSLRLKQRIPEVALFRQDLSTHRHTAQPDGLKVVFLKVMLTLQKTSKGS